jgi:catechol-2,3-dioxygenase
LNRIDHIHVFVANRATAEDWYARVLGLSRVPELEFWAPDGGPLTLTDPSGAIHLALFERPPQPCRSTIALATGGAELLAWREHLGRELGKTIELVDHQVSWSLYFSDPDGNPFEITSYDYATVAARREPSP